MQAGILPADIESFAAGFSRINLRDTKDVRKACDLAMEIVRKVSDNQASPADPGCLDLIVGSTQTSLATLKAIGHKDDRAEVPDQSELWEMEQNRRKVKKEKEDVSKI